LDQLIKVFNLTILHVAERTIAEKLRIAYKSRLRELVTVPGVPECVNEGAT